MAGIHCWVPNHFHPDSAVRNPQSNAFQTRRFMSDEMLDDLGLDTTTNPCWQDIFDEDCAMDTVYSASFIARDWIKSMPCAAGVDVSRVVEAGELMIWINLLLPGFSIGHDHIHFFSSVCCRAISKFLIVLSFWLPVAEELPSCRRHFRIVLHVIERTAILCFSPFFTTSYAHCNRMTACRKTWTFHKLTQMPGLITSKLWTFWISNAQLQSMRSNQAPEEAADWPPKPPIYTYIHSKSKSEFSY